MISKLLLVVFLILSVGCSKKILRPDLINKITKQPQLEDYHDRWFLGFVRSSYTNPTLACVNDTPVKVVDFFSIEDFLLSLIFFGIYTPATTHVWCVDEKVSI